MLSLLSGYQLITSLCYVPLKKKQWNKVHFLLLLLLHTYSYLIFYIYIIYVWLIQIIFRVRKHCIIGQNSFTFKVCLVSFQMLTET